MLLWRNGLHGESKEHKHFRHDVGTFFIMINRTENYSFVPEDLIHLARILRDNFRPSFLVL